MNLRTAALTGGRFAVAIVLLAACNSDGGTEESTSTTVRARTTTTTTPQNCDLLTPPPTGEVTYTLAGRLLAVAPNEGARPRCLARDGATEQPQWNGAGDRVEFGDELIFSKPNGISVLRITNNKLEKKPVDATDDAWTDITFLAEHEQALYHPAGRHIVSVGTNDQAVHGIYIADNQGQKPKRIVQGEGAIKELEWTVSGALAFIAEHDGQHHLHRLEFPTLDLTTVAEKPQPISDVAAARFEGGGLAWSEGGCTLRVNRNNKVVAVPPGIASTTPIGWLPDGVLITQQKSLCAGTTPGPVYAFRPDTNTVDLLADKADAVAIRAQLPVGPAFEDLPDDIESDAPV